MQDDIAAYILSFAGQIDVSLGDARKAAISRNWVDAQGCVTEEGRALFAALRQQSQTRSVFRGV